MSCSCCGHKYSFDTVQDKEFEEQYGMCGNCYWLYDEEISDDDSISERNGLSVNKYRSLFQKYNVVRWLSDGCRPVSILDPSDIPLAYHSDDSDHQGKWGYVDKTGHEIIKPQYIFAFGFDNGTAMVCKGEWTKDEKWDNEYNTGRYWTETEKWGVIDKSGNEIIPCIYDDLNCLTDYFSNDKPIYAPMKYIHIPNKDYVKTKVAIFDNTGNMLLDFHYTDFGYIIEHDQLIVYENGTKWDENAFCGVYDMKFRKELIKPKYPYLEIVNNNIFLVSDDSDNGFNATLINDKEEAISDIKFRHVSQDLDDDSLYEGSLDTETKFKFRIEKNQLIKVD